MHQSKKSLTRIRYGVAILAGITAATAGFAQPAAPTAGQLNAIAVLKTMRPDTPPEERLAIVGRALASLPEPTPMRGELLCARGGILQMTDRLPEALEAFRQCEQLLPDDPRVLQALTYISSQLDRPEDTARFFIRFVELSETADPGIGFGFHESLRRELQYAKAFDLDRKLSQALVRKGWYRDDPRAFSFMAKDALLAELEAGNRDGALAILPQITAPFTGAALLIDRRYEAIWPAVEAWAGDNMRAQRDATVRSARAAYDAEGSAGKRLNYLVALSTTGQRDQAIEGYAAWLAQPAGADESHERSLAVMRLGNDLAFVGREDEAIAVMTKALNELDRDGQLNVAPNLAVDLILANRGSEALALLTRYSPSDADLEAPAANGYFYALRACALQSMGRTSEARQLEAQVLTAYANNARAVAILTSCMWEDVQLVDYFIGRLADPQERETTILGIASAQYRQVNGIPSRSIGEKAYDRVFARPELQRAYRTYARPMPTAYEAVLNNFAPPLK